MNLITIIRKAGALIGRRRTINLIEGSNVTLTVQDDSVNDRVNVTIAAAGGSGSPSGLDTYVQYNDGGSFGGEAAFTYDKTTNKLTVDNIHTGTIQAHTSAGVVIEATGGADCALFGAGGGQNVTFYDGVKLDASTASRILSTDASKNITALDTATYPSLTELTYLKGVTSSIQTQLNGKQASGSYATLTGAESLTNKKLGSLTSNGFVKTSGGDGTLSVDTNTYLTSTNISDTAYGAGWDTDTTNAPSKNAIYDKINAMDTTIAGKQNTLTNPVTGTGTNNEIAAFNSTGSTITSLTTATYPSLTELSYVKGVTSSLQTQLNEKEPTITNGFGITGTTTKAVSLTTSSAYCTAETTISAVTYADITGASITLAAGTWLLLATINGSSQTTTVAVMMVAITNGANAVISESSQHIPAGTATVRTWGSVHLSAIVSPSGSTTYKLRGARGTTTQTGNWIASDGNGVNTVNNVSNNSDKGTVIMAVRIA